MCNTCCNFDEWESCETQLKVQLLSPFSSFNFVLPFSLFLSLSLSLFSSIETFSPSFLSKAHSWWRNSFFHGLFLNGYRLLSPLFLYLLLHLHGEKSSLKDLIEAQRFSLHRSFTSKLPRPNDDQAWWASPKNGHSRNQTTLSLSSSANPSFGPPSSHPHYEVGCTMLWRDWSLRMGL